MVLASNEVFDKVSKGIINPNISVLNFSELPKIHEEMESRKTIGSIVVTF